MSIDANRHKREEDRDAYGRLVEVREYTGTDPAFALYATTRYGYGVLGNLDNVTDAAGNITRIVYDTLSRKTWMSDPDMGYWTYHNDADGNLDSQTDARGYTIGFAYDALNRLTSKHYPSGPDVVYAYDELFSTNPKGRLTTINDPSGTTKFFYDKLGRTTRTVKTVDGVDYTTDTSYDALGRTTAVTYPETSPETVSYSYNTGGSLQSVVGSVTYATYSNYNALGQAGNVAYGNGDNTVYQYHPQNNRLFSITSNSQSQGGVQNLSYAYGESDSDKYICPRTLWTMRTLLSAKELDTVLFNQVTGKLARVFSADTKNQRLDSVHVFSNMRHLGRIGIFVRVITKFLVNLKRHHPDLFESLPRSFAERYLTRKGQGVFSMVKPSQTDRTLEALGSDLFDLVRRFAGNDDVCAMSSYKQMSRVLCEQCTVISGENKDAVTVKPPGEVSSGSLQNPSDPDATYCGHKGQGYQAQVMETYVPAAGDDGEKAPGLSLITHVSVEQAHESDANALIPAITDAGDRGLAPAEVLADAAYGSEKNVAGAKALGTEVVAPVPGGEKNSKLSRLSHFAFTAQDGIASCPMGHAPIKDAARGNHREVVFSVEHCLGCPKRKECPVRSVREGYGFSYDKKQVRMARRRARERSDAFKEKYRFRAGIEGTFSALDRKTGVKQLRVRGFPAVRFAVVLKVLGLNLLRAAAVWSPGNGGRPAPDGGMSRILGGIVSVHAKFVHLIRLISNQLASNACPAPVWAAMAA